MNATETEPVLELKAMRLPRGTLGELDLRFGRGLHVLTGPNGVGKTTLLNVIAGSLPPAGGRMLYAGRPLDHREARVVLAPNAPPDMPWIRSGLLLEFIASLYPASRRDSAYAARVVGALGLDAFLDAPLGTLSAGTARKLLLAAALIAAPPVMLFDEPTNDIDAASITAFIAFVGEIAAQRVILITTHHAGDLQSLRPTVHAFRNGDIPRFLANGDGLGAHSSVPVC
ncbi:MAG TPA: ATP-binding cassette domain-containing protein [Steroidobacteraceae bacterium]|nr:ATP-binding cassette domain-containing protein [Steroidobacteraceae bacterium]